VDRFEATSHAIAWFSPAPGFRRVTPIPHIAGLGDTTHQYISTVAYKLTDPLAFNCETFGRTKL